MQVRCMLVLVAELAVLVHVYVLRWNGPLVRVCMVLVIVRVGVLVHQRLVNVKVAVLFANEHKRADDHEGDGNKKGPGR